MKAIFLALLATTAFSAPALAALRLECQVKNPCGYEEVDDLGACVRLITLESEREGSGTQYIHFKTQSDGDKPRLKPVAFEISLSQSGREITFQDETGDQNGALLQVSPGYYAGVITVDQDFPFAVSCSNRGTVF